MFDLNAHIGIDTPVSGSVSANTNSSAVDMQGYNSLLFFAKAATGDSTNSTTITFREGDDTNVTNSSAMNVGRYDSILLDDTDTHQASVVPTKRYVFATLTKAGAAQVVTRGFVQGNKVEAS